MVAVLVDKQHARVLCELQEERLSIVDGALPTFTVKTPHVASLATAGKDACV